MKKIITVAVVAIGFLTWRMGAMQQNVNDEDQVTFLTSDQQKITVPKARAQLFEMIKDMLGDTDSGENRDILLKNVSAMILQRLLGDLDWVLQVRADIQGGESEPQRIARRVQALVVPPYTQQAVEDRVENLRAANFLNSPELRQRYRREIIGMLTSTQGMRDAQHRAVFENALQVISYISSDARRQIIEDLVWVSTVRQGGPAGENPAARTARIEGIIRTLPALPYSATALSNRIEAFQLIDDLNLPELSQRYKKEIASLFISDGSFEALLLNNKAYMTILRTMSPELKNEIFNRYMSRFFALDECIIEHNAPIKAATFSPQGTKIATASLDRSTKIAEKIGSAWLEMRIFRYNNPLNTVQFSPAGNRVVTTSTQGAHIVYERTARVWAEEATINHPLARNAIFSQTQQGILRVLTESTSMVKIAGLNADNKWIQQYETQLWPMQDIKAAVFSPDGTKMAMVCQGRIRLLELNGVKWQNVDEINQESGFLPIFSSDGHRMLIRGVGVVIMCYRNGQWQEEYSNLLSHRDAVLSRNGTQMAILATDYSISILRYNGNTWQVVYTIPPQTVVLGIALSPDGTRLVTMPGNKNRASIIRLDNNAWIVEHIIMHDYFLHNAFFSPDGRRIAIFGNNTVKIVKLSNDAWVEEGTFPNAISSAVFSPTNTRIITIHNDSMARIRLLLEGDNFDQSLFIEFVLWVRRVRPMGFKPNNWLIERLQNYEGQERVDLDKILDVVLPGMKQAEPRMQQIEPSAKRRKIENNNNNNDDE